MANNYAIQILRTGDSGITSTNQNVELLDGQPFYNKKKNYLTIGDGTKTANGLPITVPTVEGWFDDIANPTTATEGENIKYLENVSDGDTNNYYIRPSKHYFKKDSIVNMLEIHSSGIHLDGDVKVNKQIDFGEDNPSIDYNVRITSYIDTKDDTTPILKINSNKRTVNDSGEEVITPGKVDIFGGAGIRLSSTSVGSSTPQRLTGSTINIEGSSGDTDTRSITLDTASLSLNSKTVITGTKNPGEDTVSPETKDIPLVVTTGQKEESNQLGAKKYTIASLIVGPRDLYSYEGSKQTINGNFTYTPCSLAINQRPRAGVIIGNGIVQVGSNIQGSYQGDCVGIGCAPYSAYKLKVDGTAAITGDLNVGDKVTLQYDSGLNALKFVFI